MTEYYGPYLDKSSGKYRIRWTDPDGKARSKSFPSEASAQDFLNLKAGEQVTAGELGAEWWRPDPETDGWLGLAPVEAPNGTLTWWLENGANLAAHCHDAARRGDEDRVKLMERAIKAWASLKPDLNTHRAYRQEQEKGLGEP